MCPKLYQNYVFELIFVIVFSKNIWNASAPLITTNLHTADKLNQSTTMLAFGYTSTRIFFRETFCLVRLTKAFTC